MYSRKVEFLYNLVFETLELLSKQRKAKGENTKEKGLVHQVMDDPVVVLDSSIFGERSIIDLKPDDKEMQRRTAMNVWILLPLNARTILSATQFSVSTSRAWG